MLFPYNYCRRYSGVLVANAQRASKRKRQTFVASISGNIMILPAATITSSSPTLTRSLLLTKNDSCKRLLSSAKNQQQQAMPSIDTIQKIQQQQAAVPFSIDTLRKIKKDLVEADTNHDKKIDFEELKNILSKYNNAFSDDQIDQIGELFYVGTSGTPVKHTTFLRSLQYIAAQTESTMNTGDPVQDEVAKRHYKNPLQLESINAKHQCWINPGDSSARFDNIQKQFDTMMLHYIRHVNMIQVIGGENVLQKASDMFYEKATKDGRLAKFFSTKDAHKMERLKRHTNNFMRVAFSKDILASKNDAFYKGIKKAHTKLIEKEGLNEEHFDLMVMHFIETLKELHIDCDVIDMATEIVLSFRFLFVFKRS